MRSHFFESEIIYSIEILLKFILQGSAENVSIGPGNVFLNKPGANTCPNDEPVHCWARAYKHMRTHAHTHTHTHARTHTLARTHAHTHTHTLVSGIRELNQTSALES